MKNRQIAEAGNFNARQGKEVMESFLKSPDAKQITALFAHNDDMALGAIQAMEEAGIKPGKGHSHRFDRWSERRI